MSEDKKEQHTSFWSMCVVVQQDLQLLRGTVQQYNVVLSLSLLFEACDTRRRFYCFRPSLSPAPYFLFFSPPSVLILLGIELCLLFQDMRRLDRNPYTSIFVVLQKKVVVCLRVPTPPRPSTHKHKPVTKQSLGKHDANDMV